MGVAVHTHARGLRDIELRLLLLLAETGLLLAEACRLRSETVLLLWEAGLLRGELVLQSARRRLEGLSRRVGKRTPCLRAIDERLLV